MWAICWTNHICIIINIIIIHILSVTKQFWEISHSCESFKKQSNVRPGRSHPPVRGARTRLNDSFDWLVIIRLQSQGDCGLINIMKPNYRGEWWLLCKHTNFPLHTRKWRWHKTSSTRDWFIIVSQQLIDIYKVRTLHCNSIILFCEADRQADWTGM